MACVITFNNKKYSYEEFASMLHDGELNKMVSDGLIDESMLSGDMSVLFKGATEGAAEGTTEGVIKVYHGGAVKSLDSASKEDPLFVSEDSSQAKEYTRENGGKVSSFEINEKGVSTEENAYSTIKKLGLNPEDQNWSADELNLFELIDPKFDTALSDSDINKLFSDLEDQGFGAIRFNDTNLKTLKQDVENIVIFNKDLVKPEQDLMSQKVASEKSSGTTQVATTTGSYVKAANLIKDIKGKVLDYGAGLGLGTDAMSETLGKDVDSYEPNPERWQGKKGATYTSSDKINKKYDAIVSLNVLNVVPKDIRDAIVKDIFSKLNVNGKAVISTRKWSGDVNGAKNAVPGDEEKSLLITRKQGGKDVKVFQKGFDGNELTDYVKSLLGDNAEVVKNTTFGANGVIVTKTAEKEIASQASPLKNVESTTKALEGKDLGSVKGDLLYRGQQKGEPIGRWFTRSKDFAQKFSESLRGGKKSKNGEVIEHTLFGKVLDFPYLVTEYANISDKLGGMFGVTKQEIVDAIAKTDKSLSEGNVIRIHSLLENKGFQELLAKKGFDYVRAKEKISPKEEVDTFLKISDKSQEQLISESYHKAKEDGSNPKLVKAVEDVVGTEEGKPVNIDKSLKAREIEPVAEEKEIVSQAPKMRRTIENEDITNKEEREQLVTNPESFQNPAVMADERKAAEDMTDGEINAVIDSMKDMDINDESPKNLFPLIEAIKRATKSPDRKFMGRSIQDLLPEAAKLASFAGKVLRFIQDLKTKTPEVLSSTLEAMIEKYGNIRLSPEQKTELEQVASEFMSTKAAYEEALAEFKKNPDILNEKIKDHAYKMHEAANIKIKALMARYTPPSFYKRFIANAQGNLLVAASHGVNAVSNLSRAVAQEAPKAIIKTAFDLAQNLYYYLSNNKNLMFKLGIIAGSNGLVKAINPTLYQMKNNILYGTNAQIDATIREGGSSVQLKTIYDWITNPNTRIRVKGSKQYIAIGNKIYEQGKLEKDALMITESTELNAEITAAAMTQEGGVYQAFGNEVWKMKESKHGNLVEELAYPPAATEDQKTAIDLQAEKKAYQMSTVPATGMMAKSSILQLSGITAEMTQRLTSTMDILFNNPQSVAILEAEAARLKITSEQLLEFAATDKEFKKYLEGRLKSTTFQEDTAISTSISKFEKGIRQYLDKPKDSILDKSLSNAAKIAYVAGKLSALFVKTPLNIGIQLVDICTYGSISFAKAISSGSKIASSKGAQKTMNQIKFRDYMAAGVASMGLALAAMAIVAAGCATGDYDSYDKKQLDALQTAKTPLSSINLSAVQRMLNGGSTEWVEGDRVLPAKYFGLLGMTIMYFASNENKADKAKMAAASSGTKSRVETKEGHLDFALDIPRIVMSQSSVSSANTVLKAMSDKESRSWPGVAKQYAQGVVAGLGMPGTVSKAIEEPIIPDLIDMSSSVKTAKNTAKYRLLGRFYERMTGYESGLPLKVDALGRYITSVPEGQDVTLYNLNPFQLSSYRKDPTASRFLELYEQTKDPKVVPSKLRQGVLHKVSTWDPTIDEFTLIGEDIEALNLKRGAMVYESLKSLFTSGYNVYDENIEDYKLVPYDSLPLEQKRSAVSNTIAQAYRRFSPQLDQYLEALAERTGTPVSEIKKSKLLIDGYEEPEPLSDF